MTDVLDPPITPEVPAPRPDRAASAVPGAGAPARWLLAALLGAAAAIHLAMAPSHLGESAVEGAGFLAAAWAQVGLAVLVVTRPTRTALASSAGVNLALIAAWGVSRTTGLPFGAHRGHPETVSLVDGATVALEAAAVVLAVLLLARAAAPFARSVGVALAGTVGACALATAAIASPSARDHAAGSHGDGANHAAADHAAADQAGAGGPGGHAHDAAPEDDLGFSALSNGHQHERGNEPLTPDEMVALAGQLATTTELMRQYPTLAHAEAAGWTRAGPFSPGLGVHYSGRFVPNPDGRMDTDDLLAPMLIFDGLGPDAKLAGFMYLAYGNATEPEGFAGPNDHWHFHEHVCIVTDPVDGSIDTPFGADLDDVTEQMCTDAGGSWIASTGYMVHVWNVPGYESPDGTFTELNPAITCPDGTYYTIPTKDVGDRNSTCLDP
ncbi:MAG TPA: hypothetical protein VFI47_14420 [Acidimicrobiales bacterium]|nr:hypothetical protein [Acidimicrobiales bacterium]